MVDWIKKEKIANKIYKEKGRLKFQTALSMGIRQMSDYIVF